MENHHFSWDNQLWMAIFNSYVKLPEGIQPKLGDLIRKLIPDIPLICFTSSSRSRSEAAAPARSSPSSASASVRGASQGWTRRRRVTMYGGARWRRWPRERPGTGGSRRKCWKNGGEGWGSRIKKDKTNSEWCEMVEMFWCSEFL